MLETVAVELCSELLLMVNLIVLIFSCTFPRRVFSSCDVGESS